MDRLYKIKWQDRLIHYFLLPVTTNSRVQFLLSTSTYFFKKLLANSFMKEKLLIKNTNKKHIRNIFRTYFTLTKG